MGPERRMPHGQASARYLWSLRVLRARRWCVGEIGRVDRRGDHDLNRISRQGEIRDFDRGGQHRDGSQEGGNRERRRIGTAAAGTRRLRLRRGGMMHRTRLLAGVVRARALLLRDGRRHGGAHRRRTDHHRGRLAEQPNADDAGEMPPNRPHAASLAQRPARCG